MTETSLPFTGLQRAGLPAQVASHIEAMILEGSLRVGDRLPAERALAEQLEVARPVLREAIRLLEGRGLLRRRQGSGTWVQELAVDQVQQQLRRGFQMVAVSDATTKMYELRLSIEPTIAALAAARATDHQLAQLQERAETLVERARVVSLDADSGVNAQSAESAQSTQQRVMSASFEAFVAADQAFHEALWQAAGNDYFGMLLQPLLETLAMAMSEQMDGANRDRLLRIAQRHKHIVDAVRQRDGTAAFRAMRQHFLDDDAGPAMPGDGHHELLTALSFLTSSTADG